jgi:hypothetical protein
MNREDIIRMAQEAELVRFEGGELEAYGIAKASLDDHSRACWRIADEQRLKRFAALIAAAEREECATLCDGVAGAAKINTAVLPESHHRMVAADDCADLIRARGRG